MRKHPAAGSIECGDIQKSQIVVKLNCLCLSAFKLRAAQNIVAQEVIALCVIRKISVAGFDFNRAKIGKVGA